MSKETRKSDGWEPDVWGDRPVIDRQRITRGNYLRCFCPHCDEKLNDGDMAVFEVVNSEGQIGIVRLAAYLNVFYRETSLDIEEGSELRDARCPHCHESLILNNEQCPKDGSKIGGFKISVGVTKVDIRICVRNGCHWYHLDTDAEQWLIIEDNDDW